MPTDLIILLIAISIGAAVQAGVGIGFSIIVAPIMMVMLGTAIAVPVLLLLNTLVSAVAIEPRIWAIEKTLIRNAIIGCLAGILLGTLIYPFLTESVVLSLTAGLLLIGVLSSFLPQKTAIGPFGFKAVSGLAGLATAWAATPGPLMMLGLLALNKTAREARKLVQPVALIAYGTAFALHSLWDWEATAQVEGLGVFAVAAAFGAILGRVIGPWLPQKAITVAIQLISVVACVALFRRAYLVGN